MWSECGGFCHGIQGSEKERERDSDRERERERTAEDTSEGHK